MADNPTISQITLPSGNTYDLKDSVARAAINGMFVIAWNGTGTATAGNVPAGVVAGSVTGTLAASESTLGKIYLVKSSTQQDPTLLDVYDEYVTVGSGSNPVTYSWEKLGDTQIKLGQIVTGVTFHKVTATVITGYTPTTASVIGPNSTFTMTQPTITVTPTTTYLTATVSSVAVSVSASNAQNAVLGYNEPDSSNFLTGITTTKNKKLVTTKITGVSGAVTASKVSAGTSQTTLNGQVTSNTSNDAWLKGWSVSGEVLTIGGVLPTTQTTTQMVIDVTSVTVPKAASTSTTVATGSIDTTGTGDTVVTDVTSSSSSALTGLGTATTASVLGSSATFKLTNSAVTLGTNSASAAGRVSVATGITSAAATNGSVAWNSKDSTTVVTGLGTSTTASVLTSSTTITVSKTV